MNNGIVLLLCLVAAGSLEVQSYDGCPLEGGTALTGTLCVKLLTDEKRTYQESHDKCGDLGGFLFEAKDQEIEQLAIGYLDQFKDTLNDWNDAAYIALEREEGTCDSKWVWKNLYIGQYTDVTYSNWRRNEPSCKNGKETVGSIIYWDGEWGWNDKDKTVPLYAFCAGLMAP